MRLRRLAAIVFALASAGVVAFQVALALGAPWGEFAMGGAFPGVYPPALRIAAFVQAMFIAFVAAVVLSRAGVAFSRWEKAARWLIWPVVALMALSVALNLLTPSGGERAIWAPVAIVMFACALVVAAGKRVPGQA